MNERNSQSDSDRSGNPAMHHHNVKVGILRKYYGASLIERRARFSQSEKSPSTVKKIRFYLRLWISCRERIVNPLSIISIIPLIRALAALAVVKHGIL